MAIYTAFSEKNGKNQEYWQGLKRSKPNIHSVLNLISWNQIDCASDTLPIVYDVVFNTFSPSLVFWVSIMVDVQTVSIAIASASVVVMGL